MAQVEFLGRIIELQLGRGARRQLAQRSTPLIAEMELYFSCLVRKRVRFSETPRESPTVMAQPGLALCFSPVTTATCSVADNGDDVPLTAMPVKNPAAYLPHWLKIDFRQGQWHGEFGYRSGGRRR